MREVSDGKELDLGRWRAGFRRGHQLMGWFLREHEFLHLVVGQDEGASVVNRMNRLRGRGGDHALTATFGDGVIGFQDAGDPESLVPFW